MNILITREEEKYQKFADKLKAVGLNPLSLPMIECVPVPAIIKGHYDYLVFTSLNSAKYFVTYTGKVTCDKIVAVGSATAQALLEIGLKTDLLPENASAESLKALFSDIDVTGKKFLFPGAETRAGDFHKYLQDKGADVSLVTIYKTHPVSYPEGYIEKFLRENKVNVVTFASPSAARAMLENIEGMTQQIICIGKTTADTVREIGYDARYPDDFSLDWMVKLITELS